MTGIDFRGRRRFRDRAATERLSALLREEHGTADPADHGPAAAGGSTAAREGTGDASGHRVPPEHAPGGAEGAQHREDVVVRRRLTRPALVALCLVLLLALGISGVRLLTGGDEQDAVVTAADAEDTDRDRGAGATTAGPADGTAARHARGASPTRGPGEGAGSPTGGGAAESPGGVVTVHVVGEVRDPAVVTLPPGARVMDAVEAAGGFTRAAVKDRINLAEPVRDGAQITIPNAGNADAVAAARSGDAASGAPPAGRGAADAAGGSGAHGPDGVGSPDGGVSSGAGTGGSRGTRAEEKPGAGAGTGVNLNTATQAELEDLPKVGPVLAQRIIEFRTQHGPFTAPEQLDDVTGVGPAMLEALLPLVTV
ncbi:ComEA family DNA-binding protein [Kocuria tytonis]|uniref:ComEA family DNA-binding protein n=1 Tax=Kocuria tytonis TaxID=2054280 RepID=UPI0018F4EE51|nr:ComEA family DNA-binding protein [Kocuria tytonis]